MPVLLPRKPVNNYPVPGWKETEPEPDVQALKASLERGMADVAAGRVRPISEVAALLWQWPGKS